MASQTKLSPDEVAAQGEAWYATLKSQVEPGNIGHYIVIDIETGEYDIGDDYISPTERLLQKKPGAELYAIRIGYRSIDRTGRLCQLNNSNLLHPLLVNRPS